MSKQNDIISKHAKAVVQRIESVLRDSFIHVAEQFVRDARATDTYKDRTGNLRGSIGYTLFKDGVEVFGMFEGVGDAAISSKALVERVRPNFQKGFALICVAGMEYAAFVEAKGYDVITGAALLAESNMSEELQRMIKRLTT